MAKSFLNREDLPLGLRNNNPGNLRTGQGWLGEIGANKGFAVFKSVDWGLRALAMDLRNKISNGYNTVQKIITRYAPPSENDTAAYISKVAKSTGFGVNQLLNGDTETIAKLIRAIVTVENGPGYSTNVTDTDIAEGMALLTWKTILKNPAVIGTGIAGAAILFAAALFSRKDK